MSNSSQPPTYSTISIDPLGSITSDTITITGLSNTDTITLNSGVTYTYAASPSLSPSPLTTSTISSINNIGSFNWSGGKDFIDKFPEWDRIKSMCNQYPSLEIALRNFETIYQLVKDDYDNPTPKK
jgi:hypothetical protein